MSKSIEQIQKEFEECINCGELYDINEANCPKCFLINLDYKAVDNE